MIITSKIYNIETFTQNEKQNRKKKIYWKGKNINNDEIIIPLSELIKENISLQEFYKIIKIQFSKNDEHLFLFKLTLVAQFNLNFFDYCKVINIFTSWNLLCKKIYHSTEFFKKMLLGKNIGEQFPIKSPEELKFKLKLFNKIAGFIVLTYFDILDLSSKDLINHKITTNQYINIIYMILKAANKKFEKEICIRALDTFKKVNNAEKIKFFQNILNNNHNFNYI